MSDQEVNLLWPKFQALPNVEGCWPTGHGFCLCTSGPVVIPSELQRFVAEIMETGVITKQ